MAYDHRGRQISDSHANLVNAMRRAAARRLVSGEQQPYGGTGVGKAEMDTAADMDPGFDERRVRSVYKNTGGGGGSASGDMGDNSDMDDDTDSRFY